VVPEYCDRLDPVARCGASFIGSGGLFNEGTPSWWYDDDFNSRGLVSLRSAPLKQKRSTSPMGLTQRVASIEEKTPVEMTPSTPTDASPDSGSGVFASAISPFSRLKAETVLSVWTAIVAACVVWQPLVLGFYYGDWETWVKGSTEGMPFSLTRFLSMNFINPARPGCLPARFLCSSILGDHPLLLQGALLLVNCGVAVSIVAAARVLTQCRTPIGRTITAGAGLCWLLLPWNSAARFWPSLLPNTSTIAMEGILCVVLIRGWEKNQSRVIAAGSLYLWMCISYEAFYLQWVPIVLIGAVLWMAKRTAARPVIGSAIAMVAAQAIAGLWNLYTKQQHYWTVMYVLPDWTQIVRRNLLNLVPAILRSVSEVSVEFALCGVIVVVMWLVGYVRSFSHASDRRADFTSALLAGISVIGGLVSIVVYSLAGRVVLPTGVDTRSMMVFNFWILIAAAILTIFVMDHLSRVPKLAFTCALAGFGLCLAVGQVLRASDWVTAWSLQNKVLTEAPVSDLKRTAQDARIILLNPREVNGAPIFSVGGDIHYAIAWAYPFLRSRRFIVYNPWEGRMKWSGSQLSYEGQPALETTAAIYLWRPSDQSFWRPAGPFVINQDLTVEPAQ
jgi:hypothetical protein